MISDQASQRPATDVLVDERERLDIENAPEIRGDSFEEDCVVYSTEWDSDNEDAVSWDPLCKKYSLTHIFRSLKCDLPNGSDAMMPNGQISCVKSRAQNQEDLHPHKAR